MRRVWTVAFLFLLLGGATQTAQAGAATRSQCEGEEQFFRGLASKYDWMTQAEKDEWVAEQVAPCWQGVRADEESKAANEAQTHREEQEAAEKEPPKHHPGPGNVSHGGRSRKPTVHRQTAELLLLHSLSKQSWWRHREYGEIDCRGGRVNRTAWVCKIELAWHYSCYRGKGRVEGAWRNPNEHKRPWFTTSAHVRRCFP